MNTLLLNLIKKHYVQYPTGEEFSAFSFAEELLRECAKLPYADAVGILEHFGVEE